MMLARRRRPRRYTIEVTHRQIELPHLPAALAGLRLVQLSDIHHGLYMPRERVARAVALANRLQPDLLALTGDFVSSSRSFIAPVAELLGGLRARRGVFAVLGNHDYRVGAERMATALRRRGIEVLRNRHMRVECDGASLFVAGVDDIGYGEDQLQEAMRGIRSETSTLLLCHNPAILPHAAAYGIDLVLSGHTHGGQVGLRRLRAFARRRGLRLPLSHGWHELNDTQIYISRGLGTVILPIRVRCPAEIVLLSLQPTNGSSHAGA